MVGPKNVPPLQHGLRLFLMVMNLEQASINDLDLLLEEMVGQEVSACQVKSLFQAIVEKSLMARLAAGTQKRFLFGLSEIFKKLPENERVDLGYLMGETCRGFGLRALQDWHLELFCRNTLRIPMKDEDLLGEFEPMASILDVEPPNSTHVLLDFHFSPD